MGKWLDLALSLSKFSSLANSANSADSSKSVRNHGPNEPFGTNDPIGTGDEFLKSSEQFGTQAAADARTLATIIDADPTISLDRCRALVAGAGIAGERFAFGLVALPERINRLVL